MQENSGTLRVTALTLGCKVNQYDTEAVLEAFAAAGFKVVTPEEGADAYLINTCTVTNVADKKSRQLIRKIIREHPDAVVAVFGCYAQTQASKITEIPGVSIVVGTQRRAELVELVTEALQKEAGEPCNLVEPFSRSGFEELIVSDFGVKVRAVLKIQEGCQQFCAYCKVPFARGPERSREVEAVLATAETLVQEGYKEIVLTGIHLAGYGQDLRPNSSLVDIARKVSEISGLERLRLSSVEPTDVNPELLELIALHPQVCSHLHMPLQSGSSSVLKRMRRKYDTDEYRDIVRRARALNPELGLTTDIIVGFPGESQEEFAETVDFVKEISFSRLHVFPYSRRSGTPAAKMPDQIPGPEKAKRTQELIKVGEELAQAFHQSFLKRQLSVLFEEESEGVGQGYTENYIRVKAKTAGSDRGNPEPLVGTIRQVLMQEADSFGASGIIVDKEVTR